MTLAPEAQDAPLTQAPLPPRAKRSKTHPVRLTVIVPATNAPATLDRCLAAVTGSLGPADELIVVREPADAGPAEARNCAAELAEGDVLVFVDADVELHADALPRVRRRFDEDPELSALFGSYDDAPAAPGIVSRFRNLLHHHVHSTSDGPATTFWTGVGAIRREAFASSGGFRAGRYAKASIEDVELGMRLAGAGARIELDAAIRGCHLKRWTLAGMVRTDFAHRGVPWTQLLIETKQAPAVLNLGWRHRASGAASALAAAALIRRRPVAAAAGLGAMIALNSRFYVLLTRRCGAPEAALGIGLHVIHYLTAVASVPTGAALHLHRRDGSSSAGADERSVEPSSHEVGPTASRLRGRARAELRVGLVGCGRLAERAYIAAAQNADGVTLAAVADPEPDRCIAVAPGLPAFGSAEELVESGIVEALVVASPAGTHLVAARAAAGAGLPALVEKPPAADAAGALQLAALDPAPWTGFNRRFEPELAELARRARATDWIDLRLSFSARRSAWGAYSGGDDVLVDLGPHLIDLARWLPGAEVEGVRAHVTVERASLELDLGLRGRAVIELAGDRPWREEFAVRDGHGTLVGRRVVGGVAGHAQRLRRKRAPHPLALSLARQLEAFRDVAGGADSLDLADALDGVAAMAVIDAARASSAAGGALVDPRAIAALGHKATA